MVQSEILSHLKIGLIKGYKQNLLLLTSYNDFIDQVREYLLTVNVAQQLIKWNENHSYKINIEYPVLYFYNNAFLSFDEDFINVFDMPVTYRQLGHSPTEKLFQKIDLAITEEQQGANGSTHERTIVGIELKGINKNENDIKDDARRMARAMIRADAISDNSIEFCVCGFLRRFDSDDEMITANDIANNITSETAHWNNICNELKQEFTNLNFSIDIFEVINTPVELIRGVHLEMGSDYHQVANETGNVVGGILIINRL